VSTPAVLVAELWHGRRVIGPAPDPPLTQADLDALAVALTAQNDGLRPTVRVVERFPALRRRAAAGSLHP